MINDLSYEGIKYMKNDRNEKKKDICINVFCYENYLTYPVYVSDQKIKMFMDLLLISDDNKSRYAYIKDFNRFMCNKTKNKNKKHFCKSCLQCFSGEKILIEQRKLLNNKW